MGVAVEHKSAVTIYAPVVVGRKGGCDEFRTTSSARVMNVRWTAKHLAPGKYR
jgi:hypothetical protein